MTAGDSPIRVLYLARAPFVSGAERALMSQLRHLDRTRIEPHLVLGCETALLDDAAKLNIATDVLPMPKRSPRSLLAWWRSLRKLRRIVRRFQPDVLHANDVPSCQAMSVIGRELQLPRVVHVRWVIGAGEAAWWARAGAERLLCISGWMRQQLGDTTGTALADTQSVVLPDAVDWPAEDTSPKQRLWPEAVTLGFAGQLIESKGLDLVIESMGRLPEEQRPRLLVAGRDTQTGGAYEKTLRELAQRCGVADRITWLGFVDDVATLYAKVTAMVCPSRVEPLGLVPLEAARFGVPTVANRVGGLAETIQHEQTGWLVEPSVEAWAAALPAVADRKVNEQLGEAARQRTIAHYSPASYQASLMAMYAKLAGRSDA